MDICKNKTIFRRQGYLLDFFVFIAALSLAIISTRHHLPLMDDVYITIRHAQNFAHGDGLVYNSGEPLLAATSPLYTLLLSIPAFLECNLEYLSLCIWCFLLGTTGYLLYIILERSLLGGVLAALLITHSSIQTIQGMETAFFILLGYLLVYNLQKNRIALSSILVGLLWMTRPDGVFHAALLFAYALVTKQKWLPTLLPFLLITIGWSLLLYFYYGYPVPHSAIAKYYQGKITWWWPDHATFAKQIIETLIQDRYILLVLFSSFCAMGWLMRDWIKGKTLSKSWLDLGVVLWPIAYSGAYSMSHVPAYQNYFFPFHAMLFLGFGLVTRRTYNALMNKTPVRIRSLTSQHLFLSSSSCLLSFIVAGYLSYQTPNLLHAPKRNESDYKDIGLWLNEHSTPDRYVGAVEIGIIGYYSKAPIVDFAGLVSPQVAKQIASGNTRYAIETYRPEFVVARFPTPLALEGGLYPEELIGGYQKKFSTNGIGVFEASRYDITQIVEKAQKYETILNNPILLSSYPLPKEVESKLRKEFQASGWRLNEPPTSQDFTPFYKMHFLEGTLDRITPLLSYSEKQATKEAIEYTFDSATIPFTPLQGIGSLVIKDETLVIQTNANENSLLLDALELSPPYYSTIKVRLRITPNSLFEKFKTDDIYIRWLTSEENDWKHPAGSINTPSIVDGNFHTYTFDLSSRSDWLAGGSISKLRLDLNHFPGQVEIESFSLS